MSRKLRPEKKIFFHIALTVDYLKTSCLQFVDTMSQAESAERGKKISLRWYIPLPDHENNPQDSYGFSVAL